MSRPTITNFAVERAAHNPSLLRSPAAKRLLDSLRLIRTRCKFTVNGVSSELANALRRALMTTPCKKLYVPENAIDVSDPDLWGSYIAKRISLLPITQDIPEKSEFSVNFHNNTDQIQYVYSSEITNKQGSAREYFDGVYEICSLSPGFHLKIDSITVLAGHNTADNTRHYNLVYDAASVPVGVEPYNEYTRSGVSSREANPQVFDVSFSLNGEADPATVARNACLSLSRRINQFAADATVESRGGDEYEIYMKEDLTIGGPLSVTIFDMNPDEIGCITFTDRNGILVLRLRTSKDPNSVLGSAAAYLSQLYSDLATDII